MKASYLLTGILLCNLVAWTQKPFLINGTITGKTNDYIYLYYVSGPDETTATDSALIKNGRFSFTGKLPGPVQATLAMDKQNRMAAKYTQVFIGPGNMKLALDYNRFAESVALKGSPVQEEMDVLTKARAPIYEQLKPLSEAYNKANNTYIEAMKAKKDEATLESLKGAANTAKEAMEPLYEQMNTIDGAFMDKYPQSFVTASVLRYRISGMLLPEAEARYNKLKEEVKASYLGRAIKAEVDGLRNGSPGAAAYSFAAMEINGSGLKLSDFRGKYVLLDFWASWCVPCRKGNPHLLSLYAKYKDKGLEIIGISDDDSKPEAWRKAVEQDKIGVWKHVLRGLKHKPDGGFDRSESISDQYGIHSLPTKILIDPKGVIVGRYGGGGEDDAAMDKKLAEVFAQDSLTLHIGDAAPAIKYSQWLKGTPVTSYDDNRVYVLEFWATWCGPCIAAMPHLSELSDKYKDKATFIGVNVYEKTGDQPYESSLPAVTRFVNSSANRMRYDVIADNNAQEMANLWLKPAGIGGIPTTFVVSKGKIVWIGHPIKLDSIMDPVIAGTFDVAAFKKDYEVKSVASLKQSNEIKAIFAAVKEAADAKDFKKAFLAVDEGIQKMPILSMVLKGEKFKILLNHFTESEALQYARELNKENKSFASMIAVEICEKEGLSKEAYLYAADSFRSALEGYKFSLLYDKLALAYSKAGDAKAAVEAEEKAVAAAKAEIKDPQFGGRVFDYTITGYEETLNKYKKAVKN
ncbi:AhpC/TSA family protein [Pseudoflavitalea sp. X16]|uniref:TlpA disulfide reductase family protein n=1 Tax=Paraflavitalea devenefica TaxID=2716334 RepID=UPI0014200565|nr:TlpA disulfide reductase family protein [Paraflavitalea devenefica]NII29339.1 AhpC/TSA family protein [Paraflavitalea devenefica]